MTPADFTAELSDRPRRRGLHVQPADLTAFVADLPPGPSGATDIQALVERFIDAQETHAQEARKARAARYALNDGLRMAVTAGMGAIAVVGTLAYIGSAHPAPEWPLALYFLIGLGFLPILGTAAFGVIRAVRAYATLARTRRDRSGLSVAASDTWRAAEGLGGIPSAEAGD